MNKKTILITGSTSGIGKATALGLASQGFRIILLSRSKEKLEKTKDEIVSATRNHDVFTIQCDLSSQNAIYNASSKIHAKFTKIDVLINNAAILLPKMEFTVDGIEKTFAINHLAYFLLTGLLLDLIKKADQGRILNVSSRCHNKYKFMLEKLLAYKIHGKYNLYCRSKLANIMFTISLANKLKDTNITVNALHPGLIFTNIGLDKPDILRILSNIYKKYFADTPEEGAETSIYLAISDDVKDVTGQYFVKKKMSSYSKQASKADIREKLWSSSEKLTGFKYNI